MRQFLGVLILFFGLGAGQGGTDSTQISDVAFTAFVDGTEQRYVLMLPADFRAEQPHDVLIALHGHGSDRWQFIRESRDECRAARDVAAECRMIFVSPDYRAPTSWMGPKAEADLVQIIGDLKQRFHVGRVFISGGSMGGTASLTFGVLHPELADGIVSLNGTADLVQFEGFAEAIAESFGGSKLTRPEEYGKRSAAFWPERFTMPLGITAGGMDDVVPPQSSVKLASELKERGRPVLLRYREETGHLTSYDDARAVLEFVIQAAGISTKQGKTVPNRTLTEWRFDREGDLRGWQPNRDLTEVAVTNGALHCRAIGGDPILELQPRLNIPVSPWQIVEIRLKADREGTAELFWSGTDQGRFGGFSQEKTTRFPVNGDNAWHTYRLRPFWQAEGWLMRLRFDVYDAARFELGELRVLEPLLPVASTNADFDFKTGDCDWRGEDGAKVTCRDGMLVIEATPSAGFAAAPPVDIDTREKNWVSVRMAINRGRHATLLFGTSASSGLHRFSFPIRADGLEHTCNLDLLGSAHWGGRVNALALRPSDDPAATCRVRRLAVATAPQGEAEMEVGSLALEEFPARAARPLTVTAVVENCGGESVSNISGALRLPEGVRVISEPSVVISVIKPGETMNLRWRVQADRAVEGDATVTVVASNAHAVIRSARLGFTSIPTVAQGDYVPVPQPVRGPFEVGVYYFPGWQSAGQWQPIQRFPERRPVLGWYREGEPEVADWQIKWAVEHGITFFIYDWYWSQGQRQLEHALHDGYFKARYRALLKFCLLWANHNAPGSHSFDDCLAVTRYWIANYFHRPEHLTVDGKPLMVIFAPQRLSEDLGQNKVRVALDAMRSECVRAGLKGLYLVACVADAAQARAAAAEGYDGVTGYTWPHLGVPAGEFRAPYASILEGYRRNWRHISEAAGIPLLPPVCGGWDSRPWHGENNYIRFERTPALFRQHLTDARELIETHASAGSVRNLLIIEAWNEWGEGAYIEPQREWGFGYLDAIREALTGAPGRHLDIAPIDIVRGPFDVVSTGSNQTSWEFRSGDEGWHGLMNVSTPVITNGCLRLLTTARDPALVSPPLQVRASEFTRLRFRLRLTAGDGGASTDQGQIYWSTEQFQESAATGAYFEVVADGQWREYEVAVSRNPRWRGRITRLRLDPCERPEMKAELEWLHLEP